MNGPCHLAGGLCAGFAVAYLEHAGFGGALLSGVSGLLVAKKPDADAGWHRGYNHRSVIHSAGFGLLVGLVAFWIVPYDALPRAAAGVLRAVFHGLAAGYLSHLALDAVTHERIPLLTRGGPRVGAAVVKTGGPIGALVQGLVCVALLVLAAYFLAGSAGLSSAQTFEELYGGLPW